MERVARNNLGLSWSGFGAEQMGPVGGAMVRMSPSVSAGLSRLFSSPSAGPGLSPTTPQ